jgi:hypothetical protein
MESEVVIQILRKLRQREREASNQVMLHKWGMRGCASRGGWRASFGEVLEIRGVLLNPNLTAIRIMTL